jgi:cell division septation protein DedD
MSEERHTGGRQTFLGLAAVILGGLLFAAGVMVGRQLGVDDNNRPRDDLERIDLRDDRQVDGGGLVFHKELSKTPEPSRREPPAREEPKPAPADAPKPAPRPAPESAKSTASPDKSSGNFSLQVASYRDAAQAEQLKKKLTSKGYGRVRVVQGEVPGKGTYFRVRLGPFDNRQAAQQAKEKLKAGEGIKALVVAEE